LTATFSFCHFEPKVRNLISVSSQGRLLKSGYWL